MAVKKITTTLAANRSIISGLFPLAFTTLLKVSRSGIVYTQVSGSPGSGEFRFSGLYSISFASTEKGNPGGEPVTIVYKD